MGNAKRLCLLCLMRKNKIHGFTWADQDWIRLMIFKNFADLDWIGPMVFKNFADQDWIGFNFCGSGLDSDWKISESAHLWYSLIAWWYLCVRIPWRVQSLCCCHNLWFKFCCMWSVFFDFVMCYVSRRPLQAINDASAWKQVCCFGILMQVLCTTNVDFNAVLSRFSSKQKCKIQRFRLPELPT